MRSAATSNRVNITTGFLADQTQAMLAMYPSGDSKLLLPLEIACSTVSRLGNSNSSSDSSIRARPPHPIRKTRFKEKAFFLVCGFRFGHVTPACDADIGRAKYIG